MEKISTARIADLANNPINVIHFSLLSKADIHIHSFFVGPGAVIVSQDQKYTGTSNPKGYYRINRLAEGTYTFSITCSGYRPIVDRITFAAGTASRADFQMTDALKKVA